MYRHLNYYISLYALIALLIIVSNQNVNAIDSATSRSVQYHAPVSDNHNTSRSRNINQTTLEFTRWGANNSLILVRNMSDSIEMFNLKGVTGEQASGFMSQNLNYSGKQMIFQLGNISRLSNDNNKQISFTFIITGGSGHTAQVRYIIGPVRQQGWQGDVLYQKAIPFSSNTINLQGFTSEDLHYLKKVIITVENHSSLSNIDFGLKFE
jgi:hypothetical protein